MIAIFNQKFNFSEIIQMYNSRATNEKKFIESSITFHNRCLYNCGVGIEAVDNWDRRVSRECQLVRILCQI